MIQKSTITTAGARKATATALSANSDRVFLCIQNMDTGALYVKLGSTASSTNCDVVLYGGTVANDGKGGTFIMQDNCVYMGIITVASLANTSYIACEI